MVMKNIDTIKIFHHDTLSERSHSPSKKNQRRQKKVKSNSDTGSDCSSSVVLKVLDDFIKKTTQSGMDSTFSTTSASLSSSEILAGRSTSSVPNRINNQYTRSSSAPRSTIPRNKNRESTWQQRGDTESRRINSPNHRRDISPFFSGGSPRSLNSDRHLFEEESYPTERTKSIYHTSDQEYLITNDAVISYDPKTSKTSRGSKNSKSPTIKTLNYRGLYDDINELPKKTRREHRSPRSKGRNGYEDRSTFEVPNTSTKSQVYQDGKHDTSKSNVSPMAERHSSRNKAEAYYSEVNDQDNHQDSTREKAKKGMKKWLRSSRSHSRSKSRTPRRSKSCHARTSTESSNDVLDPFDIEFKTAKNEKYENVYSVRLMDNETRRYELSSNSSRTQMKRNNLSGFSGDTRVFNLFANGQDNMTASSYKKKQTINGSNNKTISLILPAEEDLMLDFRVEWTGSTSSTNRKITRKPSVRKLSQHEKNELYIARPDLEPSRGDNCFLCGIMDFLDDEDFEDFVTAGKVIQRLAKKCDNSIRKISRKLIREFETDIGNCFECNIEKEYVPRIDMYRVKF